MVLYAYQGTPLQPPAPQVTIAAGLTTSLSSGSKTLWLQYRSRAGYSLLSAPVSFTIDSSESAVITIPLAALPSPSGVCIWEYVLLLSNSSNPSQASVVATVPGYQGDETTPIAPPFSVTLSRDAHFVLSGTVEQLADLPPLPDRLHGMRRQVEAVNDILEWDSIRNEWVPVHPNTFNTRVTNISGINGSQQDLSAIPDFSVVIQPTYDLSGVPSPPMGFWLVNDGTQPIAQGTRIGMTIESGTEDVSYTSGIVGGVLLTLRGYVNTTTGILDTSGVGGAGTMPGLNTTIPYQGKQTGLNLPKDLPPGTACWLDVNAAFRLQDLNNRIGQGATLRFQPYFYTDFAVWNPAGKLFGDFIAADLGRRRILPGTGLTPIAQRGSGNIVVSTGGSFSFDNAGIQEVPGLSANTPNQSVWISVNGTCFVNSSQIEGSKLRAKIGTEDGVGQPTAWSGAVTLDSTRLLQVAVSYPNTIRSTYPDVVAGTIAPLNATWMRIYLKPASGNILYFEELILPGTAQSFTVGASAAIDSGLTDLPNVDDDFGLFQIPSFTPSAPIGSSTFTSGSYQIALAFRYEGSVTSISHDPVNGCIYEASASLSQVFERLLYYGEAVSTLAELRAVPRSETHPLQLRSVLSPSLLYQWVPDSLEVDDGTAASRFVRLNDSPANVPGRFVAYNRVLELGEVKTGYPGAGAASIDLIDGIYHLNLTLPAGDRGPQGESARLAIGNVTAGFEGQAQATMRGSPPNQILDLVLPMGPRGMPGRDGRDGVGGTGSGGGGTVNPVTRAEEDLMY